MADLLRDLEDLALGLAHAADEVRPELLGAEYIRRPLDRPPVMLVLVRTVHALAARALEDLRRHGIERHGEDVRAHVAHANEIRPLKRRRVGKD